MGLFDNSVALAVGQLQAEVSALRAEIATLKAAALVPNTMPVVMTVREPMSGAVMATIARLAGHDSQLQRHLMTEATLLIAEGVDEADVCASLMRGAAH